MEANSCSTALGGIAQIMKLDWKNERHRAWIIFALALLYPIAFNELCSAIWPVGNIFGNQKIVSRPLPVWTNPVFGVLPGLIAFWWLPIGSRLVRKPLAVIVISLLYTSCFAPALLSWLFLGQKIFW